MDNGDLVPDELVIAMILDKVEEEGDDGFLLGRLPAHRRPGRRARRGAREARPAADRGAARSTRPDEVVLQRLSGRRQCSNGHLYHVEFDPPKHENVCDQDGKPLFRRKDDEPDTVKKRLATYHKMTEPLKDYYDERGLLRRFDGTRDKTEVHDHIRATLATLRLEERL